MPTVLIYAKFMVQWMATKQLKNTWIFMKINTILWRNQFMRENIIRKIQSATYVINTNLSHFGHTSNISLILDTHHRQLWCSLKAVCYQIQIPLRIVDQPILFISCVCTANLHISILKLKMNWFVLIYTV